MNRPTTLLATALAFALTACNADRGAEAPSGDTGAQSSATDEASPGHPTTGDAANVGEPVNQGAMTGPADTGGTGSGSNFAAPDRKALMSVMEVDRHEIAAAESALGKGVGDEARRYAETLRADHTRNLEATSRLLGGQATPGTAGGQAAPGTGMTGTPGSGSAASDTSASRAMTSGMGGQGDDAMPKDPEVMAMAREHESERQRLDALDGKAFESAWVDAMAAGHEKALAMLDSQLPSASDQRVRSHLQSTRQAIAKHLETAKSLQTAGR